MDQSSIRINRDQYKEAVAKEKKKLMWQVICMTLMAILITLGIYFSLISRKEARRISLWFH